MQAQAPVHVANAQVGRGHRQLPLELELLLIDFSPTLMAKKGTLGSLQPSFPELFTFSALMNLA